MAPGRLNLPLDIPTATDIRRECMGREVILESLKATDCCVARSGDFKTIRLNENGISTGIVKN